MWDLPRSPDSPIVSMPADTFPHLSGAGRPLHRQFHLLTGDTSSGVTKAMVICTTIISASCRTDWWSEAEEISTANGGRSLNWNISLHLTVEIFQATSYHSQRLDIFRVSSSTIPFGVTGLSNMQVLRTWSIIILSVIRYRCLADSPSFFLKISTACQPITPCRSGTRIWP